MNFCLSMPCNYRPTLARVTARARLCSAAGADMGFPSRWVGSGRAAGRGNKAGRDSSGTAQCSLPRCCSDSASSAKSLILCNSPACVYCYSLPLRPHIRTKKTRSLQTSSPSLVKNPPAPAMEAVADANGALPDPVKASDGRGAPGAGWLQRLALKEASWAHSWHSNLTLTGEPQPVYPVHVQYGLTNA